jgi:hypothetical protein
MTLATKNSRKSCPNDVAVAAAVAVDDAVASITSVASFVIEEDDIIVVIVDAIELAMKCVVVTVDARVLVM